jgi:hypothetical protein
MAGPETAAPDHRTVDGLSGHAPPEERENRPLAAHLPPDGEQPVDGRLTGGRTAPARPHPHAPDRAPAFAGPPAAAHDRLGDRLQRRPMT